MTPAGAAGRCWGVTAAGRAVGGAETLPVIAVPFQSAWLCPPPSPPPFPPHKAHPRSGPPLGPHRSTSAGMLGKSSPSRGSPKSRAESLRLLPGPPKLPPPERAAPRPGPSLRLPGAHPPYFPFTRRRRAEMPMSAPSRRAPRTTQGTRSASSRGVQSSAGAVPAGSGSESPSGRQRRDGGFSWPPVLPAALSPLPF